MKEIRFHEPYLTGKEHVYIEDVFRERRFYGVGKYSQQATAFIKDRLQAGKVLLTDSCTSALEIAALLMRTAGEQEIILPSYTFTSTGAAFARAGFRLVFAEIDPATMMIDYDDVERKITGKTAAVVVVHYGGHAVDVGKFRTLCNGRGLRLVEDAAQAFDCRLRGKYLGTYGDFGCFSFHETKNIHCGLGGALVLGDPAFFERAVHVWERGTNRQEVIKGVVDKYSWVEVGGSFYPTEMQAAFLCAQLEALDANRREREVIHQAYYTGLNPLREKGLLSFPDFLEGYESNFHAFYVLFDCENRCDVVREGLLQERIAAYIGYVPLHSSQVGLGMGYRPESLPVTETMAKRVLRLPFHNNLCEADAARVCEVIAGLLER